MTTPISLRDLPVSESFIRDLSRAGYSAFKTRNGYLLRLDNFDYFYDNKFQIKDALFHAETEPEDSALESLSEDVFDTLNYFELEEVPEEETLLGSIPEEVKVEEPIKVGRVESEVEEETEIGAVDPEPLETGDKKPSFWKIMSEGEILCI